MSFLSNIFRSETKENWQQLAVEIGGNFVDGGFWNKDIVELKYRNSTITLDVYQQRYGNKHIPHTRIRCPFVSINEFKFNITTENALTHAGKIFGIKDVMIDVPKFDDEFYLKSRTKDKFVNFLKSEIIQKSYLELAKNDILGLEIQISDDKPNFSLQTRPRNVYWIYCEKIKVESKVETLKLWFDLCKLTLDRLIEIGEAEDISPDFQ